MPPEPLPWDRKDFFKDRKHDRPSSDSLGPSLSRWRDTPHHHGSYRWGSADFRRPSGHGKQGGWHTFSEESGSRGEGKYCRNSRENRASFNSQKDWKGHSWETTASPNANSHPHSDFVNSWDQLHFKVQHDKNGGVSNAGQRFERENSLSSIDWKPLKWARSGSLSCRGSGFSFSSSSKSMGVDSIETEIEAQPSNATPLQSLSGEAATCVSSMAPADENDSRKKRRLGWGEGLAKYEKKKVEGPDATADKETGSKNGMGDDICDLEFLHPNLANFIDKNPSLVDEPSHTPHWQEPCALGPFFKSPSLTGYSECASPATPSSFACSSSPGIEEKSYFKVATVDNDVSNPSASPCPLSQIHFEGLDFNLESLELTEIVNLSSLLSELRKSDDLSSVDSCFVRSTAMDKLLVWKADISKTLEVTESEIDSLENELKLLISDSGGACPCPAASSSLPAVCNEKSSEGKCDSSNLICRPSPLQLISSGDADGVHTQGALEEELAQVKDEDIGSPGTATSKFVEPVSLRKDVSLSDSAKHGDCSVNLDVRSVNFEVKCSLQGVSEEISGVVSACGDSSQPPASSSYAILSTDVGFLCDGEEKLYDLILASNRNSANRASEVFSKLLPTVEPCIDISRATSGPSWKSDSMIKGIFLKRKCFLRFKERVITLKFRAFQHLWKEDLRLLSIRRFRANSQKKFELSSRTVHNGYQKHRSSIRSRYSSPAGNLSLVPTTEVINYSNKLLSDSKVGICRNTLKMPALILDKKEKTISRFISDNGLVEDPCAVEKERSVINPWTSQEKEVFMNKFAVFGKDFTKIASFLNHKTIADCVEFYYKNHKSDSFQKTKKPPEFAKQGKSYSTSTYLVTSGKRWNCETNAASLDMLGAASAIAANADDGMENLRKCSSRFYVGTSSEYKLPRGDDVILERSSGLVIFGNERETAAADVLAGICGSISSEALSSCISSSVDPGDGYHQEWKYQKAGGSSKRWLLTPEVTQNDDDDETCSDESCGGEMDSADWTNEEKSIFIQAVASYGKDFTMISRCVRTRSRDQCKVFFSKARKCLGLDMMQPEPGSEGTTGANEGGGSDTEDAACMVDTGSVICCNQLTLGAMKVEHNQSDPAGNVNLQPDLNELKDDKDAEVRSDNLVSYVCVSEDKTKVDFAGESITGNGTLEEAVSEVGEAIEVANLEKARQNQDTEHVVSDEAVSGAEVEIKAVDEVSAEECSRDEIEGCELQLPGGVRFDANISDVNGLNYCPTRGPNSAPHSAKDGNASLEFVVENGHALELDATAQKKPCVISLEQDNRFLTSNSSPKDSIAIHHRKTSSDTPSKLYFRKCSDRLCQKAVSSDGYPQHVPKHSLLDCVESSQILRGYPAAVSTKKGMNGDHLSCNELASSLQSISSKLDRNLHLDRYLPQDCFLQKCNSSKPNGLVSEFPFLCQEQKQSSSSSDVEKPCRSGDVKLFGQILTHPSSQQQKPHENEDNGGAHHPKLNGASKSFNLKFNGKQSGVDRNLALPKIDQNNYFNVENNLPTRSYGFWDGNRIQTGFPSLPDSAILLAKYPTAFGSSPKSSKTEQQPLHSVVKSSERSLNGVSCFNGLSGFPTREISSSSSRVADYQNLFRSRDGSKVVQPFTVEKLRQEFLFSEMQRRKETEAMASIQQQGRSIVGINVVGREGGILVGGACNGVSDPVAAIKLHYAKSEQYSGSIVREGEAWRGKADIGR